MAFQPRELLSPRPAEPLDRDGAIRHNYKAIEDQPRRFPSILDDIQMAVVHRFSYLIYFVELQRSVSVLAVLHGHRDPQVWQRRR